MKSELYLNYRKNKNTFIAVYCILLFFAIFFFTILLGSNDLYYEYKLGIILFISLYILLLFYISLWLILHNIAIRYEEKNKAFPKIVIILAWCLFMPYIIFYGKENKQIKKQIIFAAIFNQFWFAIFLSLLSFIYFRILFKEKDILFIYLNIISLTFILTVAIIRIILFIYLFFYKRGENKFLKVSSLILMYPKIYHKIISLNNQDCISFKIKKNKLKHTPLIFEKHSKLFIHYRSRRNWFIALILFFIYIFIFSLGSAVTMSQIKYNIIFSILSFVSLLGIAYFIIWFILYKLAIKYENNNQSFPKWLKISAKVLLMSYLSKYELIKI